MSIPRTPPGGVNPSQTPPSPPLSTPAIFATLQAAAQDLQVTRAGLAVLIWFASDTNVWRRFTVTRLTSPEMLNISRKTISRALGLLIDHGYLEEHPIRGKPGEREARLIVVAPSASAR